jgi:hypothetical protein
MDEGEPEMTVKEFYISSGKIGDWECRRKIEKAVMANFKIHWNDILTDDVALHIVNAAKENK